MRNKSILRVLAVVLSCALIVPSNSVYVYAEPNSNEIEAEYSDAELIDEYGADVPEVINDGESTVDDLGDESETVKDKSTEEPEGGVVESESEIEEKEQIDDDEENEEVNEQNLAIINSDFLDEYDALILQLKDDLIGDSFSEPEMSEDNETAFNEIAEICTGSRLDYVKKYIIANGAKVDDEYVVTLKLTNVDAEYAMKYDSVNDSVEFSLLMRVTSSSGMVADYETSFYASDNAVEQMVFQIFITEGSPLMSYFSSATVKPEEISQGDIIDFSILVAVPEEMSSEYDKNLDKTASSSLEVLLLGMGNWFTQLFNSDVTVGNFGFLSYKEPATNHIWGDWSNDEGQQYRICDVCGKKDVLEQDEDWEYDAATGIKWKFSEGILTVKYGGFLEYDNAPWMDISDDVIKLILNEGITGFSEDVTYDLPNLTEIQIPATCTNIEDVWSAFDFNDKLEKNRCVFRQC